MKGGVPCLCDLHPDIRCDATHCAIAGPGSPGNPHECRVCWIRLGKKRHRIDRTKPKIEKGVAFD